MTQPTILVTGATGNTGGAVVSELLHRGVPVRAMVRTRDARSAALRARGAEVVVADIFDADQLVAATAICPRLIPSPGLSKRWDALSYYPPDGARSFAGGVGDAEPLHRPHGGHRVPGTIPRPVSSPAMIW
jgi:NAD(P)-dependent dehydrogenase (short-subunit alcohol dehydrogenase family)